MLDQNRTLLGIAAAAGVVMAACISGLPSATCPALAETYGRAIGYFGSASILSLFLAAAITTANLGRKTAWGFIIAMMTLFFLTAVTASWNLRASVKHCYIEGNEQEIKAKSHQRIDLIGPYDVKKYPSSFRAGGHW